MKRKRSTIYATHPFIPELMTTGLLRYYAEHATVEEEREAAAAELTRREAFGEEEARS